MEEKYYPLTYIQFIEQYVHLYTQMYLINVPYTLQRIVSVMHFQLLEAVDR